EETALGRRSGAVRVLVVSVPDEEEPPLLGGSPVVHSQESERPSQDRPARCRAASAAAALGGPHARLCPGGGGRSDPGSGAGTRGYPQRPPGGAGPPHSVLAPSRHSLRGASHVGARSPALAGRRGLPDACPTDCVPRVHPGGLRADRAAAA